MYLSIISICAPATLSQLLCCSMKLSSAGSLKSERYKRLGIKIYETGNLDTEYVDDYSEMNLMKRIKNFLNIRELIPVLKILIHEKPDIFMAYNNSTLTGLIVFLYKVYCKIFLVHTRLILKLDNDGSSIPAMPGARKKLINLYYGYSLKHSYEAGINNIVNRLSRNSRIETVS